MLEQQKQQLPLHLRPEREQSKQQEAHQELPGLILQASPVPENKQLQRLMEVQHQATRRQQNMMHAILPVAYL
jgi:hypothetical protein